ncbi:MAG TPA: SpoIID/LytB domain-containing protein, partial [Candidatus Brocadiia bacterium]|nr:SpoIID/LytB domain-containing protein [Candidatus Brocadiia bacterium]
EPEIRVAIFKETPSLQIRCDGPCDLTAGPSLSVITPSPDNAYTVKPSAHGFLLNGVETPAEWIEFRPRPPAALAVQNRPYPGYLRVYSAQDLLTAVNIVPLERYVGGVVGHEMYASWNIEALKAQAVASRSFALFRRLSRLRQPFDVMATTVSQRYLGDPVPSSVLDAVNQTRGIVLEYDGRVAPGYFCSTCGGYTANAEEVFGGESTAPYTPVPCPYCVSSRHFEWQADVRADDISRAVFGPGGPPVVALQAMNRRPDGRPAAIRVYTPATERDIPTAAFRSGLQNPQIKSSRFWITTAPGGFRLIGRGFGHGVGLCQYGAQQLATLGAAFDVILACYYPKLHLAKAY